MANIAALIPLAQAVQEIAAAREASFDKELADRAINSQFGSAEQCYTMSLGQAADEFGGEFARPAYLILAGCWNEGLEWAAEVLAEAKLKEVKLMQNTHNRWVVVQLEGLQKVPGSPAELDPMAALRWAESSGYVVVQKQPRLLPKSNGRKLHGTK